jgi:hypothetical protein
MAGLLTSVSHVLPIDAVFRDYGQEPLPEGLMYGC